MKFELLDDDRRAIARLIVTQYNRPMVGLDLIVKLGLGEFLEEFREEKRRQWKEWCENEPLPTFTRGCKDEEKEDD